MNVKNVQGDWGFEGGTVHPSSLRYDATGGPKPFECTGSNQSMSSKARVTGDTPCTEAGAPPSLRYGATGRGQSRCEDDRTVGGGEVTKVTIVSEVTIQIRNAARVSQVSQVKNHIRFAAEIEGNTRLTRFAV